MKIKLFLLLTLFAAVNFGGYSQEISWINSIKGTGEIYPVRSVIDQENNTYILARFDLIITDPIRITSKGAKDLFFAKFDSNGNLNWINQIGGGLTEQASGIVVDKLGNTYVLGRFQGTCDFNGTTLTSSGGVDIFLAKYSADGNLTWVTPVGTGTTFQGSQNLAIDKDGNLVVIGIFQTSINIKGKVLTEMTASYTNFVAKLDANANLIWGKKITNKDPNCYFYGISCSDDGYYFSASLIDTVYLDIAKVGSRKNSLNNYSYDILLYKTDYDGAGQWYRQIGGSKDDMNVSTEADEDGNVYVTGYFSSNDLLIDSTLTNSTLITSKLSPSSNGSYDVFFAKYLQDGTLKWMDTQGSTGDDRLNRFSVRDEIIAIAGQYEGKILFNNEELLSKGGTDALGIIHDRNDNLLYAITAGGTDKDVAQTCVIDNEGNYIVIGDFLSSNLTFDSNHLLTNPDAGKDLFIAKYKARSVTLNSTPIKCNAFGSISATPKGAWIANKTFSWTKNGDATFSSNSQIITNLEAGTYTCVVSDGTYSEAASVTLTNPVPPSIAEVVSSHKEAKCFDGTDGAFTTLATGGTLPYSYLCIGTGTGIIANQPYQSALSAGIYKVTVTDSYGCSASTNEIEIKEPSKINFKGTLVTKINGASGSVTLVVNGGTPAYSNYNWTGPLGFTPVSDPNLSGLSIAGNYKVTLKDQNSCNADTTVQIINSHSLYASITDKKDVSCFGGQDGSITILASPENASLQYSWSGPDGPLSGSFTTSVYGLKAGTYSVTITDPAPDPDATYTISEITITQPSNAVSVTLKKQDITCNGAANGILDAEAEGGTLPYTYEWKKGEEVLNAKTEVISGLLAGAYTVTVSDVNGCNFPFSETINEPDALVFSAPPEVTPVTCNSAKNDGSITLNVLGGTGALTYKWSNGVTTDQSYLGLLAGGTYSCIVSDTKNCAISTQLKVPQPDPITATITNTNVSCYGGANGKIVLDPQGGNGGSYTYAWSNNADTKEVSGLLPGTYSVVVKDAKGCEKSFSSTITAPTTDIIISQTAKQDANCFGSSTGSISVEATGAVEPLLWSWSNAKTGATVTELAAGDYTVTLIDGKNCTKSASYHIDQPTELSISEDVLLHKDIICSGASTGTLAVAASGSSGSYQYSLNGNDWLTENSFGNLPAGEYAVVVRDQTVPVCQKSLASPISITEPLLIKFSTPVISDISCSGLMDGAINAPATGGTGSLSYKLKIDGTESDNVSGASNGLFFGLGAGSNYFIEAVDANNCVVSTEALSITNPPALKLSGITPANATCAGSSNGCIQVTASGNGILNYSLLLNGIPTGNTSGANSGTFTGLGAATGYTVEITDGNKCGPLLSETVNINEPLQISISSEVATKTSGTGVNDGTITIVANGGTDPLTFSLNTGIVQNSGLFTGLSAGSYTVTVTDANQCASVVSNTLTVDNATGTSTVNGATIRLYPNPVTEKVFIKISDLEFKELKVDLKSISGQAVLTRTFDNVFSGFITDIDLSEVPKGIYVIMVNNVALKEKLVVQ